MNTTAPTAAQQDRPARPPSKTAVAKAEAQARAIARQQKREANIRLLITARQEAAKITKTMPPDYQNWGVVRTRAYVQLLEIISAKAENVTMTADRLWGYINTLKSASAWTLDYCQHLSLLHARAANIEPETAE